MFIVRLKTKRYGNLRLRYYYAALTVFGAVCALPVAAGAQDLTYQPVNPTFGGNPFNSSHLLGIANAQNDYKDPKASTTTSQGDLFARQLESRLLSAFSAQLTEAIFGANAQESGTFTLGSQTVSFYRDLENVNITIVNNETGEITKITVPLFIQVN
ncbi:MAG: curli assembly protein CsgF [Asticcacaulis sp.]